MSGVKKPCTPAPGRWRARFLATVLAVIAIASQVGPATAETIILKPVERWILGPDDGASGDAFCRAGSPGASYQLSSSSLCPGSCQGCPCRYHWVCSYSPVACPDAWTNDGASGGGLSCTRGAGFSTTKSCTTDACNSIGHPISPATGNKFLRVTDYRAAGASRALAFERIYNSDSKLPEGGFLGRRWRHTYDRMILGPKSLIDEPMLAYRPDGRIEMFRLQGGVYRPDEDIEARIELLTDPGTGAFTGYRYVNERTDEIESYNTSSQLTSVSDRAGLLLTLTYSTDTGPGVPVRGVLTRVADRYGRQLNFAYSSLASPGEYRLASFTDAAGQTYTFNYDSGRRLQSVTYPGGATETYHHENSAFPYALTGVTDRNGHRYSYYTYQADGRAQSTRLAGGVDLYTFTYGTNQTTFTSPLGESRTYNYTSILNVAQVSSVTGGAFPERIPAAQTFDANGYPSSRTDWNGNKTCLKSDAQGRELSRGEGLTAACPADVATWTPASGTAQRKITTQWHATWRQITKVCEPKRLTTLTYDVKGNIATRTEQATNDAQGALGCSATPVGLARTWTYTYTYGATNTAVATQVVINGPRTDLTDSTTSVYEESTGNLVSVTNALGHQTTFGNYDAHGNPRQITDPNSLVTVLVWDEHQRLVSRTVGTQLTPYLYDNVGQLIRVTPPDGSYLEYVYDNAHRLTEVHDNLGNRIAYTLDASGNPVKEETFDPSSTLKRTLWRVYDSLGKLRKEVHP